MATPDHHDAKVERLPEPLFELPATAAFDLSAIISNVVLGAGLSAVGLNVLAHDYLQNGWGLYLIGTSYIVFILCVLLLQNMMRISTLAQTFGKAKTLTTHGIFQFTRNPIYLMFLLPLASVAYFSIPIATASVAIYIIAMNLTVIRKEERDLQAAFGEQYTAYRNSVPRWII